MAYIFLNSFWNMTFSDILNLFVLAITVTVAYASYKVSKAIHEHTKKYDDNNNMEIEKNKRTFLVINEICIDESFLLLYERNLEPSGTLGEAFNEHPELKAKSGNLTKAFKNKLEKTNQMISYTQLGCDESKAYSTTDAEIDEAREEASILFSLIKKEKPSANIPCFCKNISKITIKNYGQPASYFIIEGCLIAYIENSKEIENPLKLQSDKSPIRINFKENNEGYLYLSEFTDDLHMSLCKAFDLKLGANLLTTDCKVAGLFYKNITLYITAVSVFSNEYQCKIVIERQGDRTITYTKDISDDERIEFYNC